MTPQEIVKTLATKVMRWEHHADFPDECQEMNDHEDCWWTEADETERRKRQEAGICPHRVLDWNPWTDHNHCHECIEKMRAEGWKFDLQSWTEGWTARGYKHKEVKVATYDLRPFTEAACLAMLRAVGVEV
ncbi:MAG: hypothetical protein B7733_08545 [Myxococcales bacterium FL481]|nr:MAG: hypothetical protein B7733_08545 [Myxococcales bacterium FL481]